VNLLIGRRVLWIGGIRKFLPTSDAYIKYLLKSAILNSEHLKKIDVICLDDDNNARNRYDNFIDFNYYRFANRNVSDLFEDLYDMESKGKRQKKEDFVPHQLEAVHEKLMFESY